MKHGKTLSAFVYLAWFVGLSIFIGCGDPEDTESADSIVIPSELYDTSQLTYEISDAEVQELMALDVPTNWSQIEDSEVTRQILPCAAPQTIREHSSRSYRCSA